MHYNAVSALLFAVGAAFQQEISKPRSTEHFNIDNYKSAIENKIIEKNNYFFLEFQSLGESDDIFFFFHGDQQRFGRKTASQFILKFLMLAENIDLHFKYFLERTKSFEKELLLLFTYKPMTVRCLSQQRSDIIFVLHQQPELYQDKDKIIVQVFKFDQRIT